MDGQCEDAAIATAAQIPAMKVIIQGKQMRLSAGIKKYAQEHVVAQLARFYDNEAAELRVELGDARGSKHGLDKECHLTLRMPGARTIQIEESTQDPYASLDAAGDRLIRAAKKEIERMRRPPGRHKYRPLATVVAEGGVPAGLVEDLPNGRSTGSAPRRRTNGSRAGNRKATQQ
jgi:putative sigma-54 modulation protein